MDTNIEWKLRGSFELATKEGQLAYSKSKRKSRWTNKGSLVNSIMVCDDEESINVVTATDEFNLNMLDCVSLTGINFNNYISTLNGKHPSTNYVNVLKNLKNSKPGMPQKQEMKNLAGRMRSSISISLSIILYVLISVF